MAIDIINDRLKTYKLVSKQSEENAIKEICQEIALAGLARQDFFTKAAFQGGTCLRIIYGLKRFSEDLDFICLKTNSSFEWQPYFRSINTEFEAFGLSLEVTNRSNANETIKKAFLKENSFGKILNLTYPRSRSDKQKILIKLEVDTNPPPGALFETHYLDYPYPFAIITQDIPSLFAGKCHALLCRKYIKGRDWFDFIWYIQNRHQINYSFLENALMQSGPYREYQIVLTKDWLIKELTKKVTAMDWNAVAMDVKKFLPNEIIHTTDNWNAPLFLAMLDKLNSYLK